VNGRPVLTLQAVREALLSVRENGPLALVIRRGGDRVSLLLRGAEAP